ncbi:hypothetical protein KCU57_06485 [Xanthomonas translucens]|uniref:hypothetical protein n=1 Tax=Xanthomonas campestris pv. translucens TaxID=343 RepID=UPI001F3055A4|nr:hypothetical protein [Xanthomonas translucens]UKE51940.1 hypothetical protein KCU57_06485 [Xanthomonas translucens]
MAIPSSFGRLHGGSLLAAIMLVACVAGSANAQSKTPTLVYNKVPQIHALLVIPGGGCTAVNARAKNGTVGPNLTSGVGYTGIGMLTPDCQDGTGAAGITGRILVHPTPNRADKILIDANGISMFH